LVQYLQKHLQVVMEVKNTPRLEAG
jgi:hypothetical protein